MFLRERLASTVLLCEAKLSAIEIANGDWWVGSPIQEHFIIGGRLCDTRGLCGNKTRVAADLVEPPDCFIVNLQRGYAT